MRTILLQSVYAFIGGLAVARHNKEMLEDLKQLQEEAIEAKQSKIAFITKMR